MTTIAYYALMALGTAVLAAIVVPPAVKFFRLIEEGEQEIAAAKQRIASRRLTTASVPNNPPDPKELT